MNAPPPTLMSPADVAKKACACRAVALVQEGMRVGMGTGSTAAFMVKRLGERVRDEGLNITGVPTSARTAALALNEGIKVVTLEEAGWLDLTIDGADEFDPELTLIKGGGGAHLQEKVVAAASDRMIVIADAGKRVCQLGVFPLPVEVIAFGWQSTKRHIDELLAEMGYGGSKVVQRMADMAPFISDEGNYILDLQLNRITDARALSQALNQIPGLVENGLFIDICDMVVIGHADGSTEVIDRKHR